MALPNGLAQVGDIGAVLSLFGQNIVDSTSTIAAPFTSIQNRAAIPNIARDLKVSMGIERIQVQSLFQVQNESGLNGEPVYAAANDDRGLVRFVGQWSQLNDAYGPRVVGGNNLTDYVEITFFGTGLNILAITDNTARDWRATVDGGAEGANLYPSAASSSIITVRNYSCNIVVPIVSGLTLGTHTVKIRSNSVFSWTFNFFGFEVVNSSTALIVNPGSGWVNGMRYSTQNTQTVPHSTTFESGVLGSRGGRVVVYQKPDGSIAKAVQPTNASSTFLAAVNHTNEEVVRSYFPSEFGSGRSDDWSTNTNTNLTRYFTLDDGTTTLTATSSQVGPFGGRYGIYFAANQFITFTFVGTGLDLEFLIGPDTSSYSIAIDGTTIGNLPYVSTASPTLKVYRIASGLPYGTHTMRITASAVNPSNIILTRFITYQPKKPTIPTSVNELADYNVMGTFVANSVGNALTMSTGVLRKTWLRENQLVGTFTIGTPDGNHLSGIGMRTSTNGDYSEYTFFGTGVDLRFYDGVGGFNFNATVAIDGVSNVSAFTTSVYGGTGTTFNATTGALVAGGAANGGYGAGLVINGLTLGLHKIRVTRTGGATMVLDTYDIITPVHSVKYNTLATTQNTLSVGSGGVSDNRKLNLIKDQPPKVYAQSIGISGNVALPNSSTFVPMADMVLTIKVTGRRAVRLDFGASLYDAASNGNVQLAIFVNGEQRSIGFWHDPTVAGQPNHVQTHTTLNLSEGTYTVQGMWKTTGGTATITAIDQARVLAATEV